MPDKIAENINWMAVPLPEIQGGFYA